MEGITTHIAILNILTYSYIYFVPRCIKNKVHLYRRRMCANSKSRMDRYVHPRMEGKREIVEMLGNSVEIC